MRARRTFSLLEMMISVVILSVLLLMVFTGLLMSQRQIDLAMTEQASQNLSRSVAQRVADELRDAALQSVTPASFANATDLQYQVVVGYEETAGELLVEPPTATGRKRLTFDAASGSLTKAEYSNGALLTYTLASGLKDVRFTLEGSNQIRIRVESEYTSSRNETAVTVSELVVVLRNAANIHN